MQRSRLYIHICLSLICFLFLSAFPGNIFARRTVPVRLLRVVDGDTLVVRLDGRAHKVRLIGIDCFECFDNPKCRRDARRWDMTVQAMIRLGRRTRTLARKWYPKGISLRLEFDRSRRDRYGRLLAYVYLDDGRMLNEEMLKQGQAMPMFYAPNVRHRERLERVYRQAVAAGRGLWAFLHPDREY